MRSVPPPSPARPATLRLALEQLALEQGALRLRASVWWAKTCPRLPFSAAGKACSNRAPGKSWKSSPCRAPWPRKAVHLHLSLVRFPRPRCGAAPGALAAWWPQGRRSAGGPARRSAAAPACPSPSRATCRRFLSSGSTRASAVTIAVRPRLPLFLARAFSLLRSLGHPPSGDSSPRARAACPRCQSTGALIGGL